MPAAQDRQTDKSKFPIFCNSISSLVPLLAQAVLRSHLDDLAGHHIVLKITNSSTYFAPSGFNKYMRIDRTPLTALPPLDAAQSSAADDPAVQTVRHSQRSWFTTWENLDGWLRNLPSAMRAEQLSFRVDALHPKGAAAGSSGSRHWSCPLKRLSFWTRVSQAFSPLVPSPARAARLFGNAQVSLLTPLFK